MPSLLQFNSTSLAPLPLVGMLAQSWMTLVIRGSLSVMVLFSNVYERPARKHFRWWYNWALRCRLEPIIEVARMLKRRFENIITYLRHRVTNAASESLNSRIQWVKYTARGFRNKQNFIHAIYFHCGGLDLAPEATK